MADDVALLVDEVRTIACSQQDLLVALAETAHEEPLCCEVLVLVGVEQLFASLRVTESASVIAKPVDVQFRVVIDGIHGVGFSLELEHRMVRQQKGSAAVGTDIKTIVEVPDLPDDGSLNLGGTDGGMALSVEHQQTVVGRSDVELVALDGKVVDGTRQQRWWQLEGVALVRS